MPWGPQVKDEPQDEMLALVREALRGGRVRAKCFGEDSVEGVLLFSA